MFLLTDGRVLVNEVDATGFGTKHWWTLSPNSAGSYINGTWRQVADSIDDRLYFGSGVFADGRVIVSGGEYSTSGSETNHSEIYDPVGNFWTSVPPPAGWANIGDAPSVILSDGRFFVGSIFTNQTAIYDPTLGSWSAGPNKLNTRSSEETWTLLPDNTVLTWDCFGHPASQKYAPTIGSWVTCGNTPVGSDLVLSNSFETGAGILLPNGSVFCMGGPPVSALYTPPPNPLLPGTWTAGPVPPLVGGQTVGQEDGPSAILPNGNVLVSLGPVVPGGGTYGGPSYMFEYDGVNLVRATDPPPPTPIRANYFARMLVLPTGEILFDNSETNLYVYTNLPPPNAAYKPTVLSYPTYVEKGLPYGVKGYQFNGVSNGSSYGDEVNNATNYPLVRLNEILTRPVYYCRTFGHSTMGVQTGTNSVSTNFVVPRTVPAGKKQLHVVANGVPSDPVSVYVLDTSGVLSFGVDQGTLVSGTVSDLKASDNSYVIVNSGHGIAQLTLKGFVPTTYVIGTLGVDFEGGVNTSGVTQTLEFYNWVTNTYETIDTRAATLFDLNLNLFGSSPVSRFIDPSSREVVARVTYLAGFNFQARIDRFVWLTGP
ncbi:MAG TPA: kelch repeat-containing protein [Fimbriimonadaceae bacterium]|nr:kelch repeat-containing protein [Fimbriimonadaceae bacterium]